MRPPLAVRAVLAAVGVLALGLLSAGFEPDGCLGAWVVVDGRIST